MRVETVAAGVVVVRLRSGVGLEIPWPKNSVAKDDERLIENLARWRLVSLIVSALLAGRRRDAEEWNKALAEN